MNHKSIYSKRTTDCSLHSSLHSSLSILLSSIYYTSANIILFDISLMSIFPPLGITLPSAEEVDPARKGKRDRESVAFLKKVRVRHGTIEDHF